jgi:hypothetical protein
MRTVFWSFVLVAGWACQAALELDDFQFNASADAGGGTDGQGGAAGQGGGRVVPPPPTAGRGGRQSAGAGGGGSDEPPDASAAADASPPCVPACELPHAEAACVDARCLIDACRGPWRDANGSPADGCEAGDVPSDGLTLWFMADQGVVSEADGSVSAWIDQSPNPSSAVQPVLAQRPTREVRPDGLPMLSFDGTNDALDLPTGFASFAGSSYFAVVEALPNSLCAGILHFSNGPDGDDVEFGRHQPNLLYYEVVGTFLNGTAQGFVVDRRLVISSVQANGVDGVGNVELRIDGSLDQIGPVALPANVERRQNYVGRNAYSEQPELCSMYFRGRIGELIFYPRGVSSAERERIEAYLLEKWL